ncbi:MAG: DeoR/GlpR family DNA-binding transcription regulator [Treponema sp.]|jgi:DeoR/GlpR family transcriptional regulator of sugar metabolism|nr:DeoR/GlpR family DNA-binding transcription regulator [Treponema sp.]
MLGIERKNKILELVQTKQAVTVTELAAELGVSIVTVRKMLGTLDRQGLLRRTRGGAVSIAMPFREPALAEKLNTAQREKHAIAALAYSLIKDQESLYLDAGTTTLALARLIKKGPKRGLVVTTNAVNLAVEFLDTPDINIVLIGGELRHSLISCVGSLAETALRGLHFDRAFMAANNVNLQFGASTPMPVEAQTKRTAIASAGESWLLCDSSKFGSASMVSFASLDAFAGLITDSGLDERLRGELTAAGVKVLISEAGSG